MAQPSKNFRSHGQQIELLRLRGMHIEDEAMARRALERVNYYRLSGYWFPYRQRSSNGGQRLDEFIAGTSFEEVLALYEFDERLRVGVLTPIELAFRSALGHELGRIDPLIHLKPNLLGPVARDPGRSAEPSRTYKSGSAGLTRNCPFRVKTSLFITRRNTRGNCPFGRLWRSSTGRIQGVVATPLISRVAPAEHW